MPISLPERPAIKALRHTSRGRFGQKKDAGGLVPTGVSLRSPRLLRRPTGRRLLAVTLLRGLTETLLGRLPEALLGWLPEPLLRLAEALLRRLAEAAGRRPAEPAATGAAQRGPATEEVLGLRDERERTGRADDDAGDECPHRRLDARRPALGEGDEATDAADEQQPAGTGDRVPGELVLEVDEHPARD